MNILYENQNIPKELECYIKADKKLQGFFEQSFGGIKPKNYCGFLFVGGQSYFIAPKISSNEDQNMNTFIYMLMYAYDTKLSNEDLADFMTREHNIFEVFIRLFSNGLLDEFKKGIFKKYITLEENLRLHRGKYVIEKNFSNFYHQNIYCEFDEFSMDNELNSFFLYAINQFKKYSHYGNLSRCEMILDEVEYFNIDVERLNIYFDRMNSRYKVSYELALMLLQKLIPLTHTSQDKSFAFLFNMGEVFEKFVGRMYQSIDSSTTLQTQKNFGSLQLKPDIMTDRIIIDTKYKMVKSREDLAVQDKYQMFAYGTNFGIKETMLLYPKHLIDVYENLELGKDEKMVRLGMRSLDLGIDGKYNEFKDVIKKRVEDLNYGSR